MKKLNILKILTICSFAILFSYCTKNKNQFTVSGEILDATDKMLYFENVGASKITILDSIQLKNNSFKFTQESPNAPDFYRLRLGNQIINIAIDSTENITINAHASTFATEYVLGGEVGQSENIKKLTLLQLQTSQIYNALQKKYQNGELSMDEYLDQTNEAIDQYKTLAREYIYANPASATAYFALFQQINNLLIFDPYDKVDSKAFGATANLWNQYYPESPRSTQLRNIFTQSLAALRGERPIEVSEVSSEKIFNISLPDINDKTIDLAEIGRGKYTLIDFTSYSLDVSLAHNMRLAEVYEKYKSKGLEIYQISLDTDSHLWKNAAVNLPWICVRDGQSVLSNTLKTYNVFNLPSTFLRNPEGDIVVRFETSNNIMETMRTIY